jgi:hypothetical protein
VPHILNRMHTSEMAFNLNTSRRTFCKLGPLREYLQLRG